MMQVFMECSVSRNFSRAIRTDSYRILRGHVSDSVHWRAVSHHFPTKSTSPLSLRIHQYHLRRRLRPISEPSLPILIHFCSQIPVATFQAAIAIPGTLNCTKTNCAPLVSLINCNYHSLVSFFPLLPVVLVFGSLLITVSILAFVLFSIHRHRKELEKTETLSNSSLNSAFRLLSWTFLAIILVVLAEVLPFAISESKGESKL